jgi:PhzF family phenazine biosynthesis protein
LKVRTVRIVTVFPAGPSGGNPAPIVIDADGMTDGEMQAVARRYGHESGFVLSARHDPDHDFALRFWVPNHEMEMCGHATVGAVWLLDHLGRLTGDTLRLRTPSGSIEACLSDGNTGERRVEISQPSGSIEDLRPDAEAAVLSVLGLSPEHCAALPIQNGRTSRVKTLVPLKSSEILDGLTPDFARIEDLCTAIGSTGLYPYAPAEGRERTFEARQFPRSSGYKEDAATGIAATALAFGLLKNGVVAEDARPLTIRQGRAMGRPSAIEVRFRFNDQGGIAGCWLGGTVRLEDEAAA